MSQQPKTKRGRKLTEPTQYYNESQAKIREWRQIVDAGAWPSGEELTVKDVLDLRNRISALKSRVAKKLEVAGLQEQIQQFKHQFQLLLQVVDEEMSQKNKELVQKLINDKILAKESDDEHENSMG